jgi:hypothetical protein
LKKESIKYKNGQPLTAVSRNGAFSLSKPEIAQKEIYISLQLTGKSSPLREAAERYQ